MVQNKDLSALKTLLRYGRIIKSETVRLVFLYLIAIVAANLAVNEWGPDISPLTAFLFIGFDLSSKDTLQDKWSGRVMRNMGLLVLGGSVLTVLLNWGAWRIAGASTAAFVLSMSADALLYHRLSKRGWTRWGRMNGSNILGSLVDSLAFPLLAFGWPPLWHICLWQFVAKVGGGFLWSLVLTMNNLKSIILGILALFVVSFWCSIIVVGMLNGGLGALEVGAWAVITVGAAAVGATFDKCPRCERVLRNVKKRRLNTAYMNEPDNWHTSCSQCHQRGVEYFEQMWNEYNSGRG